MFCVWIGRLLLLLYGRSTMCMDARGGFRAVLALETCQI